MAILLHVVQYSIVLNRRHAALVDLANFLTENKLKLQKLLKILKLQQSFEQFLTFFLLRAVESSLHCLLLIWRPDILADFPDTFFCVPWGMYERP